MERILDACFLFFHLDFSRRADLQHCNSARKLCKPFLQFLFVVIGSGLLDLCLDLVDALFDIIFLTCAFNDRGVILVDCDALRRTHV